MAVTADTVVVGVEPDLSLQDFAGILLEIGSPAAPEAAACYDAVVRYRVSPAFALAVYFEESTAGTNPNAVVIKYDTRNPGNTRSSRTGTYPLVNVPGKGNYVKFPSWAAGFADLAGRLVDEDYVYVDEGRRTIGQIIPRWAPATDNNVPERYIAGVVEKMNRWGATPQPQPEPIPMPDSITFGNVKHPPFVDRFIDKPSGAGWDDRGQRMAVGVCTHRMLGSLRGTDGYFRNPNDNGWFALTDYGLGVAAMDGPDLDGVIYRWNDPRGRRSGWASGWGREGPGYEGDGKPFVDAYGIPAVNRDLVSVEVSGMENTPITDFAFERLCQLEAYWFDQARVPWNTFPVNPAKDVVTDLEHWEFALKACPFALIRALTNRRQDRIRAILKAAQTSGVPAPAPVPTPTPTPVPKWAAKHPLPKPFDTARLNGILFLALAPGATRLMRATKTARPYEWSSFDSRPTGPDLAPGTGVQMSHTTVGKDNELWLVSGSGSRFDADAFAPAA